MLSSRRPIKIEWFYSLEGEKTKLNWFLFEVALEYYDRIKVSPELSAYCEEYDDKQIAQYCTYHAKRMKESLLRFLKGQRKSIILYREYMTEYYHDNSVATNRALHKVCMEAWEHMLSACENCPVQCLDDYVSVSMDFDKYSV